MKKVIGKPFRLADGRSFPISRAVAANGFVFTAGQLGLDAAGTLVEGGFEAQARQALDNLRGVLAEAESSLDEAVKVTGWLTEPGDFAAWNRIYAEYFDRDPPARTMVVSALLLPGALVEVEAIAVRGTGT